MLRLPGGKGLPGMALAPSARGQGMLRLAWPGRHVLGVEHCPHRRQRYSPSRSTAFDQAAMVC